MAVWRRLSVALVVCALGSSLTRGQESEKKPPETPAAFKALKYRLIGPAAGGRVCRVAGVPGDPLTYYAATASGGVWKSTDGGLTWKPIFDDQPTSSIGSIAVAPSDPERRLRRHRRGEHPRQRRGRQRHLQVHRRRQDLEARLEAGRPDRHDGRPPDERRRRLRRRARPRLRPERRARRLPHHRRRQDLAAGARQGRRHRRARRRASTRTTRAIVFAGLWQARRRPWEMTSGGPGSGLYVSRDGGDTWKQLEPARTACRKDRGARSASPSRRRTGRRVYALIEAEKGGLFRSDDGGETWSARQRPPRSIRQRAWYYSTLTVDPTNPDVVYCPQVPLLKSIDGGKTFADRQRAAPRRPPRPLDRPEEPEADDRRPTTAAWTSPPTAARRGTRRRCRSASSTTSAVDNRRPVPRHGQHAGPRHRQRAEQSA